MQRVGKIEWYSQTRGFAILSSLAADGATEKFFAHISKVLKSPEVIRQGQHVAFDVSSAAVKRPGDLPTALNIVVTETQPKIEPPSAPPQPESIEKQSGGAK